MTEIRQDPESWEAGYQDGLDGVKKRPDSVSDRLAYSSGYIEGKAVRLSFSKIDAKQATANIEKMLQRRRDNSRET